MRRVAVLALSAFGLLPSAFALLPSAVPPRHSTIDDLGSINFPTSTRSAEAQRHFIRGVAWLHSFGYDEAIEDFQAAQRLDPSFAMAYWGDAMAHDQPVWFTEDLAGARRALARLGATAAARAERAPTAREKAYLAAVETLFGEGTKEKRDRAYADAMRRLSGEYPEDLEAACFYALSLLGMVPPGEYDLEMRERAGAIAEGVFRKNPLHPGAAHIIIHAYDDREHARRALPAARAYARIAPTSSHALHMPAHIFLQLGMWDEAVASDEASFAASDARVRHRKLPITLRDYHSLAWLEYEYLQQGRYAKARETWTPIAEAVRAARGGGGSPPDRLPSEEHPHQAGAPPAAALTNDFATMRAFYVLETRRWELLKGRETFDNVDELFAVGMSAARLGDTNRTEAAAQLFEKFSRTERDPARQKLVSIMQAELEGLLHMAKGQTRDALAALERAATIEGAMSRPVGRPHPIKPAHELYGELLLETGQPREAAVQFERALWRAENRALSILGLARARAAAGEKERAREAYRQLLEIWRHADPDLADLKEARNVVGR